MTMSLSNRKAIIFHTLLKLLLITFLAFDGFIFSAPKGERKSNKSEKKIAKRRTSSKKSVMRTGFRGVARKKKINKKVKRRPMIVAVDSKDAKEIITIVEQSNKIVKVDMIKAGEDILAKSNSLKVNDYLDSTSLIEKEKSILFDLSRLLMPIVYANSLKVYIAEKNNIIAIQPENEDAIKKNIEGLRDQVNDNLEDVQKTSNVFSDEKINLHFKNILKACLNDDEMLQSFIYGVEGSDNENVLKQYISRLNLNEENKKSLIAYYIEKIFQPLEVSMVDREGKLTEIIKQKITTSTIILDAEDPSNGDSIIINKIDQLAIALIIQLYNLKNIKFDTTTGMILKNGMSIRGKILLFIGASAALMLSSYLADKMGPGLSAEEASKLKGIKKIGNKLKNVAYNFGGGWRGVEQGVSYLANTGVGKTVGGWIESVKNKGWFRKKSNDEGSVKNESSSSNPAVKASNPAQSVPANLNVEKKAEDKV